LHRDQSGTISIITVFAAILLTMLLGMVMNVGRQVDGKIRMQNAADAAAYSGGVMLARGMNSLAFTNHMLCDVFALTAFMREARDQNSARYSPAILAAWRKAGGVLEKSRFPKFVATGSAIARQTELEERLVDTYGRWSAAVSSKVLPLLEEILADELIPRYQRAVVEAFPDLAQQAVLATAQKHGDPDHGRGTMQAVLWRTSGEPVGGGGDALGRVLPVVDPEADYLPDRQKCLKAARQQRAWLSHDYLNAWNNDALEFFDVEGKMSQFSNLWRSFTCGYLEQLLQKEYPDRNLLFQIRTSPQDTADTNALLDHDYTFLALAYWHKLPEMIPGVFHNPLASDAVTYASVRMYIPHPRLVWNSNYPGGAYSLGVGGVPGEFPPVGMSSPPPPPDAKDNQVQWSVVRQDLPIHWDLLNQNWSCQLVPATQAILPTVLESVPPLPAFSGSQYKPPQLGEASSDDLQQISPH
jgi:hypothetical protein